MKTFRELIRWELQQERRSGHKGHIATEDSTGRLGASVLRKLRYLSGNSDSQPTHFSPEATPLS